MIMFDVKNKKACTDCKLNNIEADRLFKKELKKKDKIDKTLEASLPDESLFVTVNKEYQIKK